MTTAHRPTWKAAVGQANEGGWFAGGAISTQISALDAPAHTKLKVRQSHQLVDPKEALKKSLLELEDAEVKASSLPRKAVNPVIEERALQKLLTLTAEVDVEKMKRKYDDSDIDDGGGSVDEQKMMLKESDDETDLDESDDSDFDDEDDNDEDDEEALFAELAKIRAERDAAKRKAEEESEAEEQLKLEHAAVLGNPLLAVDAPTSGRMKRKWNDDVVFRNQAKGEPVPKKRFINDTVRNDFHKRFLAKFIR